MSRLLGGVIQNGYVVRDIEAAMSFSTRPWQVGRSSFSTTTMMGSTPSGTLKPSSERRHSSRRRDLSRVQIRMATDTLGGLAASGPRSEKGAAP